MWRGDQRRVLVEVLSDWCAVIPVLESSFFSPARWLFQGAQAYNTGVGSCGAGKLGESVVGFSPGCWIGLVFGSRPRDECRDDGWRF